MGKKKEKGTCACLWPSPTSANLADGVWSCNTKQAMNNISILYVNNIHPTYR